MPAKDRYHDTVVRALQKDGWTLLGEQIVIDRDNNNKPLVDALVQAGVPREQIVLAYAGETVPHAA